MKYKGYLATIKPDVESGMLIGEVIGTRDTLIFHGASVPEVCQAFQESIDLYLKACEQRGREPDKPYSGLITYRTRPRVHRALVELARQDGVSLNEFIDRVLSRKVRKALKKIVPVASAPMPGVAPVFEPGSGSEEKR